MGQENPTPEKYELWNKGAEEKLKRRIKSLIKKFKTISQNYNITQVSRLKVSRKMQENR